MEKFSRGEMLAEAKLSRHKPHPLVQILIFILVLFAVQMAVGIVVGIPMVVWMLRDGSVMAAFASGSFSAAMQAYENGPDWLTLLSLYVTALEIIFPIVYCRSIEGRSLRSMGFSRRGWFVSYVKGFALGALMLCAAAGIASLLGGMRFTVQAPQYALIALYLGGYLIQGAGEEVLIRGYFMVSLTNRISVAAAAAVSSVMFSLMHILNPGFTVLAFINIALFGAIMGLFILRSDNIWGACALHSAWNFFQGNVVGVNVSGTAAQPSIFAGIPDAGSTIINGGGFGLEGGLATTAVLLAALALVLFLPGKAAGSPDAVQA